MIENNPEGISPHRNENVNNKAVLQNNSRPKKKFLPIILTLIIIIQSALLLKIYLQKTSEPPVPQQPETEIESRFNVPNNADIKKASDKWKTFRIDTIGLTVNLPTEMFSEGYFIEVISDDASIEGKILTAYITPPDKNLSDKSLRGSMFSIFSVIATSNNYTAERGLTFSEVAHGYKYEDGEYKILQKIFDDSSRAMVVPRELAKEIISDYDVKILKVKCTYYPNKQYEALPPFYEEHDGYYGIINLDNTTYPAAVIKIINRNGLTDEAINQVFSSIQVD